MSGDESGEKEHEATQRKLDEARRKGEVPRSTDLATAAAYGGLLLAAFAVGASALRGLGETGLVLLEQADAIAPQMLGGGQALAGALIARIGAALLPLFLIPALAVLAMLLLQRGLVFAPEKLKPKLSKISPVANAKNKFGRKGLFEFAKSFAKLVIVGALLWAFIAARLPTILGTIHLTPAMISVELLSMLVQFMGLVLLVMLAIGAVDFAWQYFEHLRRQRMSHKELKDETKQSEGDPHMRQQRRRRGQEIASNRMLRDVSEADVVVTNPEHYAVALKWDRAGGGVPVCVAKGIDEIAARIRERAIEAGVPIHRDPPTARALHAGIDIGEEIRPEDYAAVAAALRFAEAMRMKARERRGW